MKKDFDQLMNGKRLYFSKENLDAVPEDQGVYVIFRRKTVVHVGRTYRGKGGLRQRLRNHLGGSSSFTNEYLKRRGKNLKRRIYTFQYLALPKRSWRRRAFLEFYATGYLCPSHIGKHQHKEAQPSK